jgi:hypothetical protein
VLQAMGGTPRRDDVLLPPKDDERINSGMRILRSVLEQLDWIAEREERSRMDIIENFCAHGIAEYEKEKGVKVQRKPFTPGLPGRPKRKK